MFKIYKLMFKIYKEMTSTHTMAFEVVLEVPELGIVF